MADGNGGNGEGTEGRCCGRLIAKMHQPHGHSGHSYFRKFRFAMSLFSLFHILAIIGSAKDVYLEKFGADATAIGCLFSVISFWSPLTEFLVGHLQDRGCLARFFPLDRWGKRAPFLLTHCIIAACAASVVYMPPSDSSGPLEIWFVVMLMLSYWGAASCVIAFESARQEIYPYKEERIVVEGLCKYTCMMGGGCGAIPVLVLMADASMLNRLGALIYIFLFGLVSLEAVPIFKEARQAKVDIKDEDTEETSTPDTGSVLDILREVKPRCCRRRNQQESAPNMAFRHLMAVKFWHGAYGASIGSTLFYYVTYVLRLGGWERLQVIAAGGLIAGVTEIGLNLVYMRLFSAGDGRNDLGGSKDRRLLHYVVFCRLLNALATFLIIGWADASITMVFLWAFTTRLGLASFSFWRVSAQCWLVDEDCIFGAVPGRKRQGIIFGALAMTQNFAGALFSSMTFLGLGLAGLETVNCEAQCKHLSSKVVDTTGVVSECIDECFLGVIAQQPESLRMYVRAVIGMWAPFCELLIAFHAWKYPIKGARLRRLYAGICQSRGEEINMKADETGTPHTGKSKIVLSMEATKSMRSSGGRIRQTTDGDGLLWRLAHTAAMVEAWPGAKSLSVFFDVNEAGPQETRVSKASRAISVSEAEGEVAKESEEVSVPSWAQIVPNITSTRLSL